MTRRARQKATSARNTRRLSVPHFALVVRFAQRWQKDAGVGTVVAPMLPYAVATFIAWTLLFFASANAAAGLQVFAV
jgi:p-aminobenzoyl-glutamate transporter AbgT